ncbi:sigma-70 family RNA polymerase sigma factor [Radiobacillus kanasensis]|uniref:sigma-70 family RNA polymerase sigma factor n=1 Tax=Radiobacillus kanasensis TaxID=2844358 RepID=UPI001E3843AB|nr:sigma-70 family RNA polymerase sigma factor [Radiobacillus kanasensis]UFT99574.1 sigma-70 family RNA polymerase sigma factor [Radiobacillus kanasensis]
MKDIDGIYHAYFQDVYRFLLSLCRDHHTAEDLVQETFFRAYLYIEHYAGGKAKTWLFTVAYRAFIDHYRKQKRTVIKDRSFFHKLFDKRKSVEDSVVIGEEIQEVIHLLEDLPIKHKHAVLLHDFHGLSQKEAAFVMDVQISHFKVLLFRGRQAIRHRKAVEDYE